MIGRVNTYTEGTHVIPIENLKERIENHAACVLPRMLEKCAAEAPDAPFVIFDEGPTWSYSEALDLARRTAGALKAIGLRQNDRLALWVPDGPDAVRLSLAVWYMGAVLVPLSPDLRGGPLENALGYVQPHMLVAPVHHLESLPAILADSLETVVAIDSEDTVKLSGGQEALPGRLLAAVGEPLAEAPSVEPWDVHTVFLTSGTTGVPKGVESTHVHAATMAADGLRFLSSSDRFMSPSAWFHIAGSYVPWAALHYRASFVVVGRFSATRFWDQVRRNGVTMTVLIGVMSDFLLNQPAKPDDADNPLRIVVQYPLQKNVELFRSRFGVEVYTQYDQTECGPPITSEIIGDNSLTSAGYCGQLRDGFSARLVNENDIEVPAGAVGELCLRCDTPWVIAARYFNMPQASLDAWRNGWYHTGDLFRQDAKGCFFFVDRSKHVIRRRGENISSFEVEQELTAFAGIAAAAAYAVPDGNDDFELMAAVELAEEHTLDVEALSSFLRTRLPGNMIPRFLRVDQNLPRSASDKINKTTLVQNGVTADSIDLAAYAASIAER